MGSPRWDLLWFAVYLIFRLIEGYKDLQCDLPDEINLLHLKIMRWNLAVWENSYINISQVLLKIIKKLAINWERQEEKASLILEHRYIKAVNPLFAVENQLMGLRLHLRSVQICNWVSIWKTLVKCWIRI